MNTNQIGSLSQSKVMTALIEIGWTVALVVGDAPYDIIVDTGMFVLRTDVKTGRLRKGVIQAHTTGVWGGKHHDSPEEVDAFGIYCPATEGVYFINRSDYYAKILSLRVAPTKNNNSKLVRWANEFVVNTHTVNHTSFVAQ